LRYPDDAFRQGSVPEIIENGVTGFVVDNIDQSLAALDQIPSIDRGRCRQVFESRFSAQRMAADYLSVYENLIDQTRRSSASLIHRQDSSARVDKNSGANGAVGNSL
jgi:hypothetical protein